MLGETLVPVEPAATDAESLEVAWVPADDVAALPLLPAFGEAWPRLRAMLGDGRTVGTIRRQHPEDPCT